jgi:hypothetical protein
VKKINRIILFGDSFIQGTGCFNKLEDDGRMVYHNHDNNRDSDLIKFQNNEGWGNNLKNYFPNVDIINYARDGYSNYESFTELNKYFINDYQETDLILFGFTSKFRDFSQSIKFIYNTHPPLLDEDNPLTFNPLAWDKKDFHLNQNFWAQKNYPKVSYSSKEKKLSDKFILDYTSYVHDDTHLDYIAKTNYVFIQNWVQEYNINFHCFDLFENYIVGNIGNFEINNDIYINYNNHQNNSLLSYLIEKEMEDEFEGLNKNTEFYVSYFERNMSFLNDTMDIVKNTELVHPNQFGYKKIIDKIAQDILIKKYK